MNTRYLTLISLSVLLLNGCLVTPALVAAEQPSLQWQVVGVPERERDYLIERLQFSPDGRHFLSARSRAYVDLYSAESRSIIWSFEQVGHRILSAGFIDNSTYFIGTESFENSDDPAARSVQTRRLSIRQVSNPGRENTYVFADGRNHPMIANGNFVYYDTQLLDRRDGRIHPVIVAHPNGPRGQLTRSGKVLTESSGQALLYDYSTEGYLHWCVDCRPSVFTQAGGAYDITASERFVVTYSHRGDCFAWALPSTESIGRCGVSSLFRTEVPIVRPHPVRDRVAVAWGKRLQVYDLDPFRRVFDQDMEEKVTGVALSAGNRLAAALPGGRILVWNVDDGSVLGHHDMNYEARFWIGNDRLSFSPDGRKLLTGIHAPVVLEIPE